MSTDPIPPDRCDLVVVGAGILGLAVAREALRRHPDLSVCVLEREAAVATHQTGRNSGVVHAGIYYEPGSLKARLCVEGARLLGAYCEERALPFKRCGKVIAATRAEEVPRLGELEQRGRANGVAGLRRLRPEELAELEPHVRGVAALHSPQTAVVDFAEVAAALAGDVRAAGGTVAVSSGVRRATARRGWLRIEHERGRTEARGAVFCAGAWSDKLAVACGGSPDPRVVPFRGAYLRLRPERSGLVTSQVYPVPDPALPFLGMHLSPTVSGEVLLGPSALLAAGRGRRRSGPRDLASTLAWPGTWRMASRWWRTGLAEMRMAASRGAFVSELRRFVPEIGPDDVVPAFSGVRAQAVGRDGRLLDDFAFSLTERALHVRNAPSPAATSCLAIARLVLDRAERELPDFDLPLRRPG